jgi:hypothetical protein
MRPRYHVITVTGYPNARKGRTKHEPGLSAHVIDRLDAHKVVATFRSEERIGGTDKIGRFNRAVTRGQEGALLAAEALAEWWNADDA